MDSPAEEPSRNAAAYADGGGRVGTAVSSFASAACARFVLLGSLPVPVAALASSRRSLRRRPGTALPLVAIGVCTGSLLDGPPFAGAYTFAPPEVEDSLRDATAIAAGYAAWMTRRPARKALSVAAVRSSLLGLQPMPRLQFVRQRRSGHDPCRCSARCVASTNAGTSRDGCSSGPRMRSAQASPAAMARARHGCSYFGLRSTLN